MFNLKTVSVVLALLIPVPALAIKQLTEAQYIKYEIKLEQFFSSPQLEGKTGTYLRTSDIERRVDGYLTCRMLTKMTTEEYLTSELNRHRTLYGDNPQKLDNEIAYTLGVAGSAVDAMCTEHRASLLDFVQKYQQNK
jgi:hypothetical protein